LNHNDFYDRGQSPALAFRHQGNRNGAKRAEIPRDREQSAEVLVCMLLAFCLAGASTGLVYRLA
jgi:hypothetical protein